MKAPILLSLFVTGFFITRTVHAAAAGSGSAGGAGGQASGSAATTAAPGARTPTPGVTQGNQLQPGSQNVPPTLGMSNNFAGNTNFVPTNQLGMNSNQMGSNNLSPTGTASGTNQFNSNVVLRDEAVTDNDQSLLVTLRQNVQSQLGASPAGMPIHFYINNGVVTLVGSVTSAAESQRILELAQRTAGVARVINDLRVGIPPTGRYSPYAPAYVGPTTDHAFSASDQNLLTTVQQTAAAQLGISQASGKPLPVHFSIERGIVGISGEVATQQQKQAVVSAIARTAGVVRVVDNLSVQTGQLNTTPAGSATTPALSPTSNGQTNSVIQNNFTNSGM